MGKFTDRLQHAWNAFMNKDPTYKSFDYGMGYSYRPDRVRFARGNERSIVNAIYNRISLDCAAIAIQHVRLDGNGRFIELVESGLNECLMSSANIDQTGRSLIQDVVASMCDEGCVAIIPTDTDIDPKKSGSYEINSLRVGQILQWFPNRVLVRVYNENTGKKEDIVLDKKSIAIVENPFYSVMNESNSTLQRLIRKLNVLDNIDNTVGANKLDLIIQLPYQVKSKARRDYAEERRKAIEQQLAESQYGIAYTESTEHVTQLNRSVDNQLMSQVEYLTDLLLSQLGITTEILNGSADEKTLNNYYSRTIEPILSAITLEMKRKFLTKTARTRGQSIEFFRDPFKLVATTDLPDIVDKFTRNEVLTSNEVRQIIGLKPAADPKADELRNKNISAAKDEVHTDLNGNPIKEEGGNNDVSEAQINKILSELEK